jgi:hypothetical protein
MDGSTFADSSSFRLVILSSAALIALGLVSAAVAFIIVGREAFRAPSPSTGEGSPAAVFGLLFLALPTLFTIVLIVLATAILTAFNVMPVDGCVAIFSSVASFVLGAETQRRRTEHGNPANGQSPPAK